MRRDSLNGIGNAMSRWREAGRAPLRWGYDAAPERRTFDDDLALLESQALDDLSGELLLFPLPGVAQAGKAA